MRLGRPRSRRPSPAAESTSAQAQAPAAPQRATAAGPSAAVAVEPRAEQAPQPVGAVELEQIRALWPAVADAVTEENGMLGAALGAAVPTAVEADRLTVAFPTDAAFVKKKAEANRELVTSALRGLTGQLARTCLRAERRGGGTRPGHPRPRPAHRAPACGVRRGGGL